MNGDEFNNTNVGQTDTQGNPGTGKCLGTIQVLKLAGTTNTKVGTPMGYTSAGWLTKGANWGWGNKKTTPLTDGEAILVNNTGSDKVIFRVSGEVSLVPQRTILKGYSYIGNPTPNEIMLGDITVCNKNGEEFNNTNVGQTDTQGNPGTGKCLGTIQVLKLAGTTNTKVGTPMGYTSAGWLTKGANWGWGSKKTTPLAAGEGLIVNNTGADSVIFKFKSPVAE